MAPAAFPALPASFLPAAAGNSLCQPCPGCLGKGPWVGARAWLGPLLLSSTSNGARRASTTPAGAPQCTARGAGRGLGCHEDTLPPPPDTPGRLGAGGCLAGVWGSAVPSRHGYRRALLPLESQEEEMSALSNLPSCSRNHLPLLYIPNTIPVKALGETPACVLPVSPDPWQRAGPPEQWAVPGSVLTRPAPGQVRGGSKFFNDNYISERI